MNLLSGLFLFLKLIFLFSVNCFFLTRKDFLFSGFISDIFWDMLLLGKSFFEFFGFPKDVFNLSFLILIKLFVVLNVLNDYILLE